MSVADTRVRIKAVFRSLRREDILTTLIIILVGFASFGLGRLSKTQEMHAPVQIYEEQLPIQEEGGEVRSAQIDTGSVVASKNGTKYHLPWCSGAQRIKEENKIWFTTIEEAKAAGYTPAANCKGI